MPISLAGKTAIVTGAANGIGLAIARHFIDRDANVMFADMDEDRLEAEVGADARGDGPIRLFAGDLREKLTIANLLSATVDAFDRVDILVNASRQMILSDPLNLEHDAVETLLKQNLMTSLRVSQMTAKRMIAQPLREAADSNGNGEADGEGSAGRTGAIINLSSIAATRTQPELLGYSIACAALDQMTRSLAVALAPRGIRVNGVAFGSVMSACLKGTLKENPGYRDAITSGTPMGRIAPASELVQTVSYLASDAASFMTGQIVTLDGGRSLIDAVHAPVF
jgi:7-alpha-hydroxysteroid dehydrogenase